MHRLPQLITASELLKNRRETDESGSKLRVLHFVPRLCWPLNTGAKLRNYHLAREIARRAQITLLTFSENGSEADGSNSTATRPSSHNQAEAAQDSGKPQLTEPQTEPSLVSPEHFYERVITVRREQGYTPAKILRGALGQTPLPVLNYTTSGMKQALERVLSEQDFDFVQVESIHLISYLPIIRAAQSRPRIILDWHNIESELMWRYSERTSNTLRRTYARRTSRQLNNLERRAVSEFDAHVVVSDRDGAKLLEHANDARVFLIENGVDTAYYSDALIEQAHKSWLARNSDAAGGSSSTRRESSNQTAPYRISFVGSMDYHANADAAVNFAQEVWPKLRERKPELIFTIVGRDPAPEVRRLADIPGVEVTGTIDDVRPYYHETLAAIIPLRVGGGSRLKILEAMAAGVAVVSTTLGAEGLDVKDGENILIADTSRDLSEAVIKISEDEELRKKLREAGRALVSEQYDWSRLGAALFETYRNLSTSKSLTPIKQ